MLEGSAVVRAEQCVYDPQSAFNPEQFNKNGSQATHLAIVANRREIAAMSGATDLVMGARTLIEQGAEVVVIKGGPDGAIVVTKDGDTKVSAYQTKRVWSVGSGDVFAAMFAARWAVHRDPPDIAADLASRAVAGYAESMDLPIAGVPDLRSTQRAPATTTPGRAYLASPFFSLGQRWLVDEARRGLFELGIDVLSPVHDIGRGVAEEVAPADLQAIKNCDRMFAVLDGLDSGTLFEVGYARANQVPVYALAQSVSAEDLKMVQGSGCRVYDDFVTALHHTAWRV
jgi:nucleoside 2-deoxyribosyltransferase